MSSLFPAYSKTSDVGGDKTSNQDKDKTEADWLKNTSFVYTDEEKLQHLNYEYLSSEQNKVEKTRCDQSQRLTSKRYVSIDHFESGEVHEAEHIPSPKKQKIEVSKSSSDSDEKRNRHHSKKKKKKKKLGKHKHSHKEDSHHKRPEAEGITITGCAPKHEGKIFLDDFDQTVPEYFHYLDKSSDKTNYTYQSIYKGHLPHYRCLRNVSLGVSITDLVSKLHNKKKNVCQERYFHSKKKTIKDDSDDIPFIEPALPSEGSSVAHREAPVLDDYIKLSECSEKTIRSNKDTKDVSAEVTTPQNSAFKKQEMYNKKLTENPNNISLWLEFINFQDQCSPTADSIALYDTERGKTMHRKQEALILQTKEAIFERAIKENPFSTELKLAQLDCFKNYWDSETVQAQWKELVMRNRSNVEVWQKYLNYVESKAALFTISNLIKAYKKCLLSLKSSVNDFVIDIFIRLCHRMKQSGHLEKATALFQAQLEYNLFAPSDTSGLSPSDLLEYFQAFWESTAPRLGETNAQGWKHWIENHGNVDPVAPFMLQDEDETLEQEILKKYSNKHDIWLAMETLRTSRHWLAWRPEGSTGYDECEDLERLVVSDDVTYALLKINKPLQKFKLLCDFLDFLGVTMVKCCCTTCRIGISEPDAKIRLEAILPIFHHQSPVTCAVKLQQQKQLTYINRQQFIENIFSQVLPLFRSSTVMCNSLIVMYVNFLEQNILFSQDKYSKKQMKAKGKEIRSAMKKLLYEEPFRHSILAWLRYAMMEWCIGRQDDARKALYHTLTSLVACQSKSVMSCLYSVEYLLYRTYAEMEIGLIPLGYLIDGQADDSEKDSRQQKALQVLISVCSGDFTAPSDNFTMTTSQLVKCKRHYDNIQNELLHKVLEGDLPDEEDCYMVSMMGSGLEHWVVCYALLVYISSGLAAATEVFHYVIVSLDGALQESEMKKDQRYNMISDIRQRLTESNITLLMFHMKLECTPLRIIRDPLMEAVQRYPINPNILWLYINLELRSAFTGNLRRHLARLCSNTKSLLVWTLSLLAQLQRLEKLKVVAMESKALSLPEAEILLPEAGYINTVRSWFQWAVSTDLCSHYLLVWRLYLQFEIQHSKPENCKRILYEAVQHCPWAKCLYMDYIEAFPASTQEVVDLMTERELRVHVPLEEIDILMEETS